MSLGELERASGVGKGYLWELERGSKANPSIEILQKIARAFGVPASELLGEQPAEPAVAESALPAGLREFLRDAEKAGAPVPPEDVAMLQQIRHRGRRPRTSADWALLYDFIRRLVR